MTNFSDKQQALNEQERIPSKYDGIWTMRKRPPAAASAVIILLLLALLLSHLTREKPMSVTRDGISMDTLIRMTVCGSDEKKLNAALDSAFALLASLNDEMSMYSKASALSAINENAGGEAVRVSRRLFSVIESAKSIHALSGGAFNPMIGPVTRLWNTKGQLSAGPDASEKFEMPGDEAISEALLLSNMDGLELTSPDLVRLKMNGAAIDLGGIAKGFASTEIAADLIAHGVTSALIDLGGNICVLGSRPDGGPWRIGIRDPLRPDGAPAASLIIGGEIAESGITAVVTSGGYERFRMIDGKRYSHLFDPRSGRPAEGSLLSATVISSDGGFADALATALMVMGRGHAEKFLIEHPEVNAVLMAEGESGLEITAQPGMMNVLNASGGIVIRYPADENR